MGRAAGHRTRQEGQRTAEETEQGYMANKRCSTFTCIDRVETKKCLSIHLACHACNKQNKTVTQYSTAQKKTYHIRQVANLIEFMKDQVSNFNNVRRMVGYAVCVCADQLAIS